MFAWLQTAVTSVADWVGDGIASLIEWLLSGIITIASAVIDGCNGIFELLDSIWEFAVGFIDSLQSLFSTFFPFVPEAVTTVIFLGLLAVFIFGIIQRVREK